MKKILISIYVLTIFLFASDKNPNEFCNSPIIDPVSGVARVDADGNEIFPVDGMVPNSCKIIGYVCNLSVETHGAVLFNIGEKDDCSSLAKTTFSMTDVPDNTLWITFGESNGVSGLYVVSTLALVLAASDNRDKVLVNYLPDDAVPSLKRNSHSILLLAVAKVN